MRTPASAPVTAKRKMRQIEGDRSLKRVFETMKDAEVIGRDLVYDRAKFVDESYLSESRR